MSLLATAASGLRAVARTVLGLALILSAPSAAFALPVGIRAIVLPELSHHSIPGEQPFGPAAPALPGGSLVEKWQVLSVRLATEIAEMMSCRAIPTECLSGPAMQLAMLADAAREREGLALVGEINRSVNLGVRFVSDAEQHGVVDRWSSPLETLKAGNGDCEDYAILKLAALRAAGIADADLRLVILRHQIRNDDHAVAAVRIDGTWRILDNQRLLMLEDWQLSGYRATFVIDRDGVHAYDAQAIAVAASNTHPAQAPSTDVGAPVQHGIETTASIGPRDL